MSTAATGTVVDETNAGLPGLIVVLHDVSALFESELARATTNGSGAFSLSYGADLTPELGPRRLRLRIRVGQHVVKEHQQDDVSTPQLAFGATQLTHADAGMLATLGTGSPSRLTQGNTLRWLCDDVDAWGHLATVLRQANANLHVMQLTLNLHDFNADPGQEQPEVVLDFNPDLRPDLPRKVGPADGRIERLLLEASKRPGLTTRIQIPNPTLDFHVIPTETVALLTSAVTAALGIGALAAGATVGGLLGGALFGLGVVALVAAGLLAILALGAIAYLGYKTAHGRFFGEDVVAKWFSDAGAANVRVRPFPTALFSVTHAKIVLHEGKEALLLGSPFLQGYYDSPQHLVDEPRRGTIEEKAPIHDVSVAVRGPAVGHLQEVFNAHWNIADPTDALPATPALPPAPTDQQSDEFLTSVQVVRTLNEGTFTAEPGGENGILEAYLRAIHFAERFIYMENQYFTNDKVADALIDSLKAKSALHVILVVNVKPDIPFYSSWQRDAIKRIAGAIPGGAQRFGAFTTWSHAATDAHHPKPRLAKNYVHAKAAIVDNKWATVGSANLDGASLDFFQVGHALQAGSIRNTETNCVVFEATPPAASAVDALRRRLWAEHLGIFDPAGKPNATSAELDDAAGKDWLNVWNAKAQSKRSGLTSAPDTVSPIHVLPWPLDVRDATSKDHLTHLNIPIAPFDLLDDGPPSFDFKQGDWRAH